MFKRITVLMAVMLMASVTFTANAAQKVRLQYAPRTGTTTTYKMKMTGKTTVSASAKVQRTDLQTAMRIQQKVTGVDRSGNSNIEMTVLDGTITINNSPTPVPTMGQIVNVKMAPNGKILSQSGSGADQQSNMGQMQIVFPDKAVGIGDNWTQKIAANPQMPIPMDAKYTLVGFEKVSGRDCVKIKSEVRSANSGGSSINLSVKADGYIWFAYKDGYMAKNEVRSEMEMIMENDLGGRREQIKTHMNLNMEMGLIK